MSDKEEIERLKKQINAMEEAFKKIEKHIDGWGHGEYCSDRTGCECYKGVFTSWIRMARAS